MARPGRDRTCTLGNTCETNDTRTVYLYLGTKMCTREGGLVGLGKGREALAGDGRSLNLGTKGGG